MILEFGLIYVLFHYYIFSYQLRLHKDAALKPVDPEEEDQMAMLERVKIQALSEHNGSEWSGLGFTSVSYYCYLILFSVTVSLKSSYLRSNHILKFLFRYYTI